MYFVFHELVRDRADEPTKKKGTHRSALLTNKAATSQSHIEDEAGVHKMLLLHFRVQKAFCALEARAE